MPTWTIKDKTKKVYFKRRKATKSTKAKRQTSKLTVVNRNVNQLIGARFITSLKYSDLPTPSSSLSTISAAHLFRLNSIYDPDSTGIGHQPVGRDQLALLYQRYRVFACSWRVEFLANTPGMVFVCPTNDSVSLAGKTFSDIKEHPRMKSRMCRSDAPTVFKGRISLPRLTGQTSAQYKAGLEYQSHFNENPSENMSLQIGAIPYGSTNSYPFTVELIYHVECFDPIPLAQS